MNENNQACIKIAKNDMVQARRKHVKTRYDFSVKLSSSGEVKLIDLPTEIMLADALTGALCEVKFAKLAISIQGSGLKFSSLDKFSGGSSYEVAD
jgi:hypothetical protein